MARRIAERRGYRRPRWREGRRRPDRRRREPRSAIGWSEIPTSWCSCSRDPMRRDSEHARSLRRPRPSRSLRRRPAHPHEWPRPPPSPRPRSSSRKPRRERTHQERPSLLLLWRSRLPRPVVQRPRRRMPRASRGAPRRRPVLPPAIAAAPPGPWPYRGPRHPPPTPLQPRRRISPGPPDLNYRTAVHAAWMDDRGEIRVIAAAFPELHDATAAESELRAQLDVETRDVSVAEAGGERSRSGLRALLAGRFRSHRRAVVDDVVSRHHGEVVADVPEHRVRRPGGHGNDGIG